MVAWINFLLLWTWFHASLEKVPGCPDSIPGCAGIGSFVVWRSFLVSWIHCRVAWAWFHGCLDWFLVPWAWFHSCLNLAPWLSGEASWLYGYTSWFPGEDFWFPGFTS